MSSERANPVDPPLAAGAAAAVGSAPEGATVFNGRPRRGRAWILYLSLLVGITALDLVTKAWAWDYLEVAHSGRPPRIDRESTREVEVIPGFFDLQATYNRGAFNGWFSDNTYALAAMSVVALVIITAIVFVSARKVPTPSPWFFAALGLIGGGTAGNFYDRATDAAVRDWIKWFVRIGEREYVWPNFNIADAGICVGVSVLIFLEIRNALRERRVAARPSRNAA